MMMKQLSSFLVLLVCQMVFSFETKQHYSQQQLKQNRSWLSDIRDRGSGNHFLRVYNGEEVTNFSKVSPDLGFPIKILSKSLSPSIPQINQVVLRCLTVAW